ncbi:hypothetical protein ACFC5Z_15075 [Streptomyces sp. NPDC056004]
MDALTDAYSSSQRENAFKDCMSDEGHPQPQPTSFALMGWA